MGRVGRTGTNSGNMSSPQLSINQENYNKLVEAISIGDLIEGLEENGIKFTKENIVFIKKDEKGKTIWLETGNDNVGLKHTVKKHGSQFKNALGISEDKIASTIANVITKENYVWGTIDYVNGIKKINKYYKYNDTYYIFTGFGDNGFIITSHPFKPKKGGK